MTISTCEWQEQTSGGTNWVEEQPVAPKPGYGGAGQPAWPGAAREIVILLHDPGDAGQGCDWNGKDTAGGFGWVDGDGCSVNVQNGNWVKINTGSDTPRTCKDQLPGLVGTTVSVPVFNCIVNDRGTPTGNWEDWSPVPNCDPTTRLSGGANSWYYIEGWAKFYVSGYQFSGDRQPSLMPGGHSVCSTAPGGGDRCLFGWFLKGELDAEAIDTSGGTDFGTFTILPAG